MSERPWLEQSGYQVSKDETFEPRDREQQQVDARAVGVQAESLAGSDGNVELDLEALLALQARRDPGLQGVDGPDVLQFAVVREAPTPIPVHDGVLLVRDSIDPDLLDSVLRELGSDSSDVDEPADLPGLLRIGSEQDADALARCARRVRAAGHQASVDHVTPLRVLLKIKGAQSPSSATGYVLPSASAAEDVTVAVLDTGVTDLVRDDGWLDGVAAATGPSHVDPLDAFPLPRGDGYLDEAAGHGTFVAGVVQQVAPAARIVVRRVVDSDGIGSEVTVAQELVRVVRDEGARIVNLSLGARTVDDQPLLAIEVALDVIQKYGALVVAAAGNRGDSTPCFPAASKRVVAVAALRADGSPAPWSSRGHWVDCSAVGEGVLSTFVQGKEESDPDGTPDTWEDDHPWAVWSGTSFAAPQVAGAVARLLGTGRYKSPREAYRALLRRGGTGPFGHPVPDFGVPVYVLPGTPPAGAGPSTSA